MRWYAAFNSYFSKKVEHCSIIDSYEKELIRQLDKSNKTRNEKQNIIKFCEYWVHELRVLFKCSTQTNAEKKAKKRKDVQERRRRQEAAEHAESLQWQERRKQTELAAEEKRRKAELLRKQQEEENKKNNLEAFLGSHQPSAVHLIVNAIEISRRRMNQYDPTSMKFSAWFSKCYPHPPVHAKFALNPTYILLLNHIESKIFLHEYSSWEIIESYLKLKGFGHQRIEEIREKSGK